MTRDDVHIRSLIERIYPILVKYTTAGCIPFTERGFDGTPTIEVEIFYGSEGCYPLHVKEVHGRRVIDAGDNSKPMKQSITLHLPEGYWYQGNGMEFVQEIKDKFCKAPLVDFKLVIMMRDGSMDQITVVERELH